MLVLPRLLISFLMGAHRQRAADSESVDVPDHMQQCLQVLAPYWSTRGHI